MTYLCARLVHDVLNVWLPFSGYWRWGMRVGILPPGAATSATAASAGKVYAFGIIE